MLIGNSWIFESDIQKCIKLFLTKKKYSILYYLFSHNRQHNFIIRGLMKLKNKTERGNVGEIRTVWIWVHGIAGIDST